MKIKFYASQIKNHLGRNLSGSLKTVTAIAALSLLSAMANAQTVETFNTPGSGTWTCPSGITTVTVECWGGGGAGGGGVATGTGAARGGGGAGGGYAKKIIAVTPGNNYNFSVGAGGLGVVPSLDNESAPSGLNTYFIDASTVNAPGGIGGKGKINSTGTAASGVGGVFDNTTSKGTITFKGGNGGTATISMSGSGGSSGGTESDGTNGGAVNTKSTVVGGGDGAAGRNNAAIGNNGGVPGGAGAGARANQGNSFVGGNGGNGQIKLTYSSNPTISSTPTSLSGFGYVEGNGPSASKLFIFTGVNLTGFTNNITVTAPADFEVSLDNSSFANSVLVEYTSATLTSTTVYVRLKSGLAAGSYSAENIAITGGGIDVAYNVACSGTVGTIYTWSGGATGSWAVSTNWTPERVTPATSDKLLFNSGSSIIVTDVPASQTISQLEVSGTTSVELQAAANSTISISGSTGNELNIASGSTLKLGGAAFTIKLLLTTGATGTCAGNLTFTGSDAAKGLNHQLFVTDADAFHFTTGAVMTSGVNFTGYPLMSTVNGAIIFESGSMFLQTSGDNPFGGGDNINRTYFNSGSTYKYTGLAGGASPAAITTKPPMATRNYSFLLIDAPAQTFSNYTPGLAYSFVNDLDIKGTLWTYASTAALGIGSIYGNVIIRQDAGIWLGNPANSTNLCHWKFEGTSGTQTVTTLDNGFFKQPAGAALTILEINNNVVFDADVEIYGTLSIASGKTLTIASGRKLTIFSGATLTNEGTIIANGTVINNGTYSGTGHVVTPGASVVTSNVNGDKLMPIGTMTISAPISFTGNSSADDISARVSASPLYKFNNNEKEVNLEWVVTESVAGDNTGTITLQWPASAQAGSFNNAGDVVVGINTGLSHSDVVLVPVTVSGSDPYTVTFNAPASFTADGTRFMVGNTTAFTVYTANKANKQSGFNVYPSVTSANLSFVAPEVVSSYTIYDISGKVVMSSKINRTSGNMNVSSLNNGMYLLKLSGEQNQFITRFKVVK